MYIFHCPYDQCMFQFALFYIEPFTIWLNLSISSLRFEGTSINTTVIPNVAFVYLTTPQIRILQTTLCILFTFLNLPIPSFPHSLPPSPTFCHFLTFSGCFVATRSKCRVHGSTQATSTRDHTHNHTSWPRRYRRSGVWGINTIQLSRHILHKQICRIVRF